MTTRKQEKPKGIRPRRCSPSSRGVKYIMVMQDTSPSGENFDAGDLLTR